MGKPGFGLGGIMGRRRSSGNALEDVEAPMPQNSAASPSQLNTESSGFRVISQSEKQELAQKQQQAPPKKTGFGRFGGFGTKSRNQSLEDDSISSKRSATRSDDSKGKTDYSSARDSKSSSGTNFSTSRPYDNNRYGSSSTLPSSADADSNDNMFSNLPSRPAIPQYPSHSHTFASSTAARKALPTLPKSRIAEFEDTTPGASSRSRGMTASSYASTAVAPPKLDAPLNFDDDSGFDDLFAGLDKRNSPELKKEANGTSAASGGRSLLAGKRLIETQPLAIKTTAGLDVEPPPKSWDSRGSDERLITSPTEDISPPPPPAHKYIPLAADSPVISTSPGPFEDTDAKLVRESFMARKSMSTPHEDSPEQKPTSLSSTAPSIQTPLTSRSASNNTTNQSSLRTNPTPSDEYDDNLFTTKSSSDATPKKPAVSARQDHLAPPSEPAGPTSSSIPRTLTQAEFAKLQQSQKLQPPEADSESEDDYEDEEEAIRKREEEELLRRKQQQQQLAREHLRKSTMPTMTMDPNRPSSRAGTPSMGFPSEVSLQADDWSDEDVPLGILKEHGFPSKNKAPVRPEDATPSYFRQSTLFPERPASAGAAGPRASAYKPVFAKKLPDDPFLGAGLLQPANRESMGFNRGPASVHGGDSYGYAPGVPPGGLVGIIQQEEQQKRLRRGGGATGKESGGPFTYEGFGSMTATANSMRMSQMPTMGMNGMPGMNMMGMGAGQPMMPMMGMNQMNPMNPMMSMGFPMQGNNEMLQMQQQMLAMHMNMQMMQQMGQMNQVNGGGMVGMPGMPGAMNGSVRAPSMMMDSLGQQHMAPMMHQQQHNMSMPNLMNGIRPMSVASSRQQTPMSGAASVMNMNMNRPFTTINMPAMPAPQPGYTPSIAPSERSNIGLASRYRPVATNPHDGISTGSSQTLQAQAQATGGAVANAANLNVTAPVPGDRASTFGKIKGILKKPSSTPPPPKSPPVKEEPEDENWGMLAARRKKFASKKEKSSEPALKDLYAELNHV